MKPREETHAATWKLGCQGSPLCLLVVRPQLHLQLQCPLPFLTLLYGCEPGAEAAERSLCELNLDQTAVIDVFLLHDVQLVVKKSNTLINANTCMGGHSRITGGSGKDRLLR